MALTKRERQALEDRKLTLEIRKNKIDILRLIIQIPLTAILLILAIIQLMKF